MNEIATQSPYDEASERPKSRCVLRHDRSGKAPLSLTKKTAQVMPISPMLKEIETDVLVIGGGIAGAFAAYKARPSAARVLLVDRSYFGRSGCSALASGVYPSYMPGDKIEDWINGLGAGPLVNQALLVKSLAVMYDHLMTMDRWGVKWLKEGKQIVRMGAPGRTFKNGVWMTEGGPQMMMAVRAGVLESGVDVLNRIAVTQLLTSDGKLPTEGRVIGAIGFHVRTGEIYAIHAKATIMCTGPYKFPYPWPGQHSRLHARGPLRRRDRHDAPGRS